MIQDGNVSDAHISGDEELTEMYPAFSQSQGLVPISFHGKMKLLNSSASRW